MRIISKFKDYYDHAAGMGIDTRLIYLRKSVLHTIKSVELEDKFQRIFKRMPTQRWSQGEEINDSRLIVGFCGKLYPAYLLSLYRQSEIKAYCYSAEDIESFLVKHKLTKLHKRFIKNYTSREINNRYSAPFCRQIMNKILSDPIIDNDLFHEYQVPVFLIEYEKLDYDNGRRNYQRGSRRTDNPEISAVNFFRIIDPYTAFQEISMYLSGVIGCNENKMIQINDSDMRDAKGFDKMSFKKYPSKHKH